MHSDPVPAITEATASGETATIFADLCATLGVSVVNLIWRHIATLPGALPWAWATVKPVYLSGRVGMEAGRIKAGLAIPGLPVWPRALLACAGVDDAAEESMTPQRSRYARSSRPTITQTRSTSRRCRHWCATSTALRPHPLPRLPIFRRSRRSKVCCRSCLGWMKSPPTLRH